MIRTGCSCVCLGFDWDRSRSFIFSSTHPSLSTLSFLLQFVSQRSISLFDPPFILPVTPPTRCYKPIGDRFAGIRVMLVSDPRLWTLTLALAIAMATKFSQFSLYNIPHRGFSIRLVYIHLMLINLSSFPSNPSTF